MHAGEGGGGRCWKHQMGSVNPEKWESKMGRQPGQGSATTTSQSWLDPERSILTQPLESAKVSHGHSEEDLKPG